MAIGILTIFAGIIVVLSFFGGQIWFFDLLSNFQLQYFFFFSITLLYHLLKKNIRLVLYAFAFFIFTGYLTFSILLEKPEQPAGETPLRLISFNITYYNKNYEEIANYFRSQSPDILILAEVNDDTFKELAERFPDYMTQKFQKRTHANHGPAIFSKLPAEKIEIMYAEQNQLIPVIKAQLQIDNRILAVYAIHPPTPVLPYTAKLRNTILKNLGEQISTNPTQTNIVVAGDMNITPWSKHFRDFLETSGLKDSRRGQGLGLSWPSFIPIPGLRIPIDHVLLSPQIKVLNRSNGPSLGSDHLPVIIDFSL